MFLLMLPTHQASKSTILCCFHFLNISHRLLFHYVQLEIFSFRNSSSCCLCSLMILMTLYLYVISYANWNQLVHTLQRRLGPLSVPHFQGFIFRSRKCTLINITAYNYRNHWTFQICKSYHANHCLDPLLS